MVGAEVEAAVAVAVAVAPRFAREASALAVAKACASEPGNWRRGAAFEARALDDGGGPP